jgi:hypothetical protein
VSAFGPPAVKQPSDPESPAAARIVWPWAAACSNRVVYSPIVPFDSAAGSHIPQLVDTTWTSSWFTIVDHRS